MDSNYGQKLFSTTKMSPIDTLKTVSKRVIQKTAEATDDNLEIRLQRRLRGPLQRVLMGIQEN